MANLRITVTRMHFGLNFIFLIIVSSIYGNKTLDSGNGSSITGSSESPANGHHTPPSSVLSLIPDEEMAHFVNQSRMVSCKFSNPDVKLKWRNPKNAIVADTKGRVHIEELGGSLTLIFESIVRSDQGNWTCEATDDGSGKVRKKSFKMIVNEPISFRDTRTVQTAVEDKDATIRCEVRGHPEPSVSWYFNGQPLFPPNGKYTMLADGLLIKRVSKNDSGEYTCKAFQVSAAGSSFQEKTIRLNIKHKPYFPKRGYGAVNVTYGYVGGAVNLTCEAAAVPPANFTWSANNKKFSHKNHPIYSGQHVSLLQIMIKNSSAFGKYKCEAKNELGTISREILLKEGTKPDPPSRFQLRGVNSDTLDIDVGAKKSHDVDPDHSTIIGYRFELIPTEEYAKHHSWDRANRRDFDVEDGVTYLLVHLIPDTKYLIRVAARNAAGLSEWTEVKEFSTHPLQPHGFNSGTSRRSGLATAALFFRFLLPLLLAAPAGSGLYSIATTSMF
ncbi:neural cell adhesion molecule 2-like [Malaya genurostris]|uniref:neural cell adhesion molecule 2-like n=1 Tax=Malaya genurostris TaxID=325434 RepID=UPI0026F38547|nr:neural cell adhesion molecule 2-like [Malaya genurostris]